MQIALIILSVILVLIILFLMFRLVRLVKASYKTKEKTVPPRERDYNQLNAIFMLAFLIVGMMVLAWYTFTASEQFLIVTASEHGKIIDQLIFITLIITGAVFLITQALLFFFAYYYRFKPQRQAYYFPINYRMELIWTVVPAITFIALFILGLNATTKIREAPDDESVVLEIVGQQFSWMVRYPGSDHELGNFDFRLIDTENNLGLDFSDPASLDDFMPRQIVIPKGKQVELKIRSRDVIHSVFLPHFKVKMDAVPGMPTRFKFTPTISTEEMRMATGNPEFDFELACTELCGRGHFAMKYIVKVVEPEEFEQWYASQKPWLAGHPDYISKVPDQIKPLAQRIIDDSEREEEGLQDYKIGVSN